MRSTVVIIALGVLSLAVAQDKTPEKRGRVLGIGGVFFKSEQNKTLYSWYEKHLGFKRDPQAGVLFHWRLPGVPDQKHSTTWAIFPATTKYFGSKKTDLMINYVVDDLDAILQRLESEGVQVDPKRGTDEAGRFGWIYDADGNKIELWEPSRKMLE